MVGGRIRCGSFVEEKKDSNPSSDMCPVTIPATLSRLPAGLTVNVSFVFLAAWVGFTCLQVGGCINKQLCLTISHLNDKATGCPTASSRCTPRIFFGGGGGADPEAIQNLCLILKVML
jgi:hypothetical protein